MTTTSLLANPARVVFGGLGWCAVVLAAAGVVVPGLPTTVFVLAASYCFSKSSPRFAHWLCTHPWFGPSLERFVAQGGMPPSAKRHALWAMWTGVLVSSVVLSGAHPMAALATLGLGGLGTLSILFAVRTVIESSHAVVDGVSVGPAGPLANQASVGDLLLPQSGLFAVARARLEQSVNRESTRGSRAGSCAFHGSISGAEFFGDTSEERPREAA